MATAVLGQDLGQELLKAMGREEIKEVKGLIIRVYVGEIVKIITEQHMTIDEFNGLKQVLKRRRFKLMEIRGDEEDPQ